MSTSRACGMLMAASALLPAGVACRPAPDEGPAVQVLTPAVPTRLDPYRDPRFACENVFLNVFEPLVDTDSEDRLVPALAESWGNPEPNVYVFRLREGVRFHDGAPLGPQAVVEAFGRARREGHFVAGGLADVLAIEVRDARTLAFRTARPMPDLVFALANVAVTRPGPDPVRQVGTGPYEVEEFDPGESVRLRRFERYRGARPFVREASFRRFADLAAARRMLSAEPLTLVLDPPRGLVDDARGRPDLEVARQPGTTLVYLAFDLRPGSTRNRPLRDRRVRAAVHVALDREALVAAAAPLGSGAPVSQLVPPGVFGFDPDRPPVTRDLPRARALLAAAGYAAGFEVQLDTSLSYEPVAATLASQLAEVGLRVRVNPMPSDDFVALIEGGSDFYMYGWVSGLESAKSLRSFLHSKDAASGRGLRNRTGYSDPEVDALLEAAVGAPSSHERLPLLRRATDRLMHDLPWVPLFVPDTARIHPRALGIRIHSDGLLRLADCWPRRPSSPTPGAGR